MTILGSVLKIGNCLNAGNKQRGQADGFELDALAKTFSIKDSEGNAIMKMITAKLYEDDESIAEFKAGFSSCFTCLKCIVDDVKKDTEKANKDLNSNKNQFELLKKVDPDVEDIPFGKQMESFLVTAEKTVTKTLAVNDEVAKLYAETCDYFMVGPQDEMRKKSEKFF